MGKTNKRQDFYIAVAFFVACWLFDGAMARYSKICPQPQRFGHERGICNERLMYVVHFQVCPLFRDGIMKYAKTPTNPSGPAIEKANEYVITKLQKQAKSNPTQRVRRSLGVANETESLDAPSLGNLIAAVDLLPSHKVSHRMKDLILRKELALALVRSGGGINSIWNNLLNPKNWTPQNIVCECCYNVCTIQEMTEYCPKLN